MVSPLDISIFDRALYRRRQARVAKNFDDHNFLHTHVQAILDDRLDDITRDFKSSLHISSTSLRAQRSNPGPEVNAWIASLASPPRNDADAIKGDIIIDEETLPFAPQSLDLITSLLTLHTVNDLPGALIQIRRALKPNGLFLAAMFGGETLYELRESLAQAEIKLKGGLSPRIYPFADKQQTGALLQRAGFALPVVDSDLITVTYPDIFKLMHDLRGMGQGNIIHARDRRNPGKALFMEAAQHYTQHFAEEDGRLPATFEVIYLLGWAPHDSQQKPLKPGSAQTRLAEALGAEEEKL